MTRKFILLAFSALSAIGFAFWRIYQLGNFIEPFNGFYKAQFSTSAIAFALTLIAFIVVVAILVFTDKNFPGSPRRTSKLLANINFAYAIIIVIEIFTLLNSSESVWDKVYMAALVLLATFFVYYAYVLLTFKKMHPAFSVVPLIFFVFKLAKEFIASFGIIKSSEVTLSILSLVFCVLFFQFFAKYISKLKFKKSRKFVLFFGVCSSVLTLSMPIADLAVGSFFEGIAPRMPVNDSFFMISTGVYILLFLFCSFSKKSLYRLYTSDSEYENYGEW